MADDKPINSGQKSDGTFAKGNKLGGRKKGSRNKTTIAVESLLEGQHEELTQRAIQMALSGDATAMRLCLDRIAPIRKDIPVDFDLPEVETIEQTAKASNAILSAVASGDISPDEGGRVMALLSAHKSILEVSDQEARLTALESQLKDRDS